MRKFTAIATLALLATSLMTAPVGAQTLASPARSQLAYSNLGQGGSFSVDYYFVSGPVNTAYSYAAPFVAGLSGHLDHIDLPLQAASSNAGAVVSIYPDQNGAPGTYNNGNALEEWLDTKLPEAAAAVKFVSKHKPMLTTGQKYWVVVAPVFYDSVVHWSLNNTNQAGVDATESGAANQWFDYQANGGVMPALDVWVK